jgi:hypothetical protein
MSGKRSSPGRGIKQYEEFRQKKVQRFESSLSQVENHSIGRNTTVVEVLCYLSLLRNNDAVPSEAPITGSAAAFQSFTGAVDRPAAHCLPCQILIDGVSPAEYVKDNNTRVEINSLFGKCTLLPLVFNHADSAAEPKGLIDAFVQASETVIRAPAMPKKVVDRQKVCEAYDTVWRPLAEQAYSAAIIQKRSTAAPLPKVVRGVGLEYGMIDLEKLEQQWEAVTGKQENVNEVIWILEKYIEGLAIKPTALSERNITEIERRFRA